MSKTLSTQEELLSDRSHPCDTIDADRPIGEKNIDCLSLYIREKLTSHVSIIAPQPAATKNAKDDKIGSWQQPSQTVAQQ